MISGFVVSHLDVELDVPQSVDEMVLPDVWARLPTVVFDGDTTRNRRWRVLDAQLRRFRSWSTALQLIKEYCDRFDPSGSVSGSGGGR